jgi:hypothetical protein
MNVTVNYKVTDIDTKYNRTSYMFRAIVDGKLIAEDVMTFENGCKYLNDMAGYFTNFYSKWAYRTHKIENANVTVSEGKWWE